MAKYYFELFSLGETKVIGDTKRVNVTVSASQAMKRKGLDYKFSCVQVGGDVFVTRVK